MPSFAMLALFLDGDLAEALHSPFIVPVFGTMMILGIVVAGIWSGVRTREMQSQERLAAIARGLPVEPTWDEAMLRAATQQAPVTQAFGRPSDGAGARRAGIVLISVGVGLIAFFGALAAILQQRDVLCGMATGLIPLAIGVGFLVDGRLRRTEFTRWAQGSRTGEMGADQVAELRPLH